MRELPDGWQTKTLGDVAKIQSGSGFPTKYQGHEGEKYPFYKVSDMNLAGNEIVMCSENNTISEDIRCKLKAKLFKPGSIIFPKVGGAIGTNKKRLVLQDCCVDNNIMGLIPKSNRINGNYLFHFMSCVDLIELSNKSNPPSIRQSTVKEYAIPFPLLPEQKRIVSILDEVFAKISKAVANAEKNLANARELFESYLNNIFTKKGEGWVEKKLAYVCDNLDSRRIPITKAKRTNGNIPYYGASGIVDYVAGYIFDEELLLVSEDGANLLARTYPIAFSISGKSWINNHAHVLRFKEIYSQRFIEYYLNSISLESCISGMAQPKLNQKSLNSILVPFPALVKQKQVVKSLDAIVKQTQRFEIIYRKKLTALAELKQSVLQKAFSGELTKGGANV